MINYILCDDNKEIINKSSEVIRKLMMGAKQQYCIKAFSCYNNEFQKIINESSTKIYILDIELTGKSGLEIAELIREKDRESIIIILTAHNQFHGEIFKSRLTILDYISKFNNYEKRLYETLQVSSDIINKTKNLIFKYNNIIYTLSYNSILYIQTCSIGVSIIVTDKGEQFTIRKSLRQLSTELEPYFFRSHRTCIVNLSQIQKIDFSNNLIHFKNKKTIDLISTRLGKKLNDYVTNN